MPEGGTRLDFLTEETAPVETPSTEVDDIKLSGPPPKDTFDSETNSTGERLDFLSVPDYGPNISEVADNPNVLLKIDPVTGAKTLLSKVSEDSRLGRERIIRDLRVSRGHDPAVDYDTGTDFDDRLAMAMADNDKERQAFLANRYGADKVFQDESGHFYIEKDGKKIAPATLGVFDDVFGDLTGTIIADAPELAGMARGAKYGSRAGIPGALIGAMVGAIGGKAVTEYEKGAFDFKRKDIGEELNEYNKTAAFAGGGEAASKLIVSPIARALSGPVPRLVSGATAETERLTAETLGMGGVPPLRSAVPEMKSAQFHQSLGEKLTGDLIEAKNLKAVQGEMENVLRSSGMPEKDIPEAMKTIMNTSEMPSYSAFGSMAKEQAQKYEQSLVRGTEDSMKAVNESLDQNLAQIRAQTKAIRAGDPEMPQKVAESISQGRKDFGRAMQRGYSQVDHLVGDTPVVPTYLPVRRAQALLSKMPESEIKPIVKEIADWRSNETFENMQRMRTRLRELGSPTNLAAAGLTKRDLRDLETLVDASFDRAFLGNAPQAAKLLRTMDATYREGIRKFQDTGVNALVDGMKTGIYPDAEKVVGLVFQRGQSSRAQEVMKMLPEDVRNKVRGEYFSNLMDRATDRTTGQISGKSLGRLVNAPGEDKLLDAAFGVKAAKELKNYAQQLAARDEKIAADVLQPGRISESIKASQTSQKALDAFLDDNYLSELAKPSLPPEKVYEHLVQRSSETQLAKAISFFGANSPQVKKLRETALVDVMHRAVAETRSGAGKTIGSEALNTALSGFTKKQQQLLFPNGLDDDLRNLAQAAKFLFPDKSSDMAAGLAAGAIKAAVPFGAGLAPLAYGAFWNYVLSRPTTVRYLALGLKQGGPAKEVALETMRNILRASALGMIPESEGDISD